MESIPPTEATYRERAVALERAADGGAYVAMTAGMITDHPDSDLLPSMLLRAAAFQLDGGRADLARSTLEGLIRRYPGDPVADIARERLAELLK
jgi:TolA-binding protein